MPNPNTGPLDMALDLSPGILSPGESNVQDITERFGESTRRSLLHHYATAITPIMVWLDSETNEYRRLIIPLAETQPVLKLAILVTSATHAGPDLDVDEDLINVASRTAIALITERVKQLTEGSANDTILLNVDVANVEAVLAAMLLLSNYSLLHSEVFLAQFHRQAARTLIKTLASIVTFDDEIYSFLRNQVSAFDVLACTALFQSRTVEHVVLPCSDFGLFGRFLKIIHAITIWPLQVAGDEDFVFPLTSMSELESQFETARGTTLLAAGTLIEAREGTFKHDFVQLVAAYHHAGVLYAYKRLRTFTLNDHAQYHLERLFEALNRVKDMPLLLANVPWPLFVAGICSCGNLDKQHKVRTFYRILSANSHYQYHNVVAKVLERLWTSPHGDWEVLSRECEDKGEPILPV
jgi:hypothetical protein